MPSSTYWLIPEFRFSPHWPHMAPALTSHSFRLPQLHPRGQRRSAAVLPSSAKKPIPPSYEVSSAIKPRRFFFDLDIKLPDTTSLVPAITSPSTSFFSLRRRKEPNTVFVTGATGQAGIRIVLALLRQGFAVRAGVPNLASAQDLAQLAAAYRTISPEESRRLNAVEVSLADPESIAKAIGPAAKAVVTVGPGENGPSAEVTAEDALRVVGAAGIAGVGHLAVVYDSQAGGAGAGQSPYNVLDGITAFFSNIFAGSPPPLTLAGLLAKVVESDGVAYTVVKAALTDDYAPESSYALVLDKEGSTSGAAPTPKNSRVSRLQIAKLVADVFSNTSVAENKVVEVSTSDAASPKPVSELLSAIPEDGRRKAYAEARAKVKEEEEKDREAEAASRKLEEEIKKLSRNEARTEESSSTLEGLLTQAKGLGEEFSWKKLSSQIATAVSPNSSVKNPQAQLATTRGQAKARDLPPRKALVKPPPQQQQQQQQQSSKPKLKQRQSEQSVKTAKAEVRNVFGGLFKQETIYIDDV